MFCFFAGHRLINHPKRGDPKINYPDAIIFMVSPMVKLLFIMIITMLHTPNDIKILPMIVVTTINQFLMAVSIPNCYDNYD